MSIISFSLALIACALSAFGGVFYQRFVHERNREIAEREDPRDTQIRDLQAKIKLINDDMRRDRQAAAEAEDHVRLAHERIVELVEQRNTLNRSLESQASLQDDKKEEIELLTDKLSLAHKQLDTLRQRNQELEVELSVVNEPNMLDDLDAGLKAEPGEDEQTDEDDPFTPEVSDNSPSLIHSLTDEIDRWKRHCQVLGGELKQQRERAPDPATAETPAIDELTDIRGIGKTLVRKLHQLGIYSFEDMLGLGEQATLDKARVLIPDIERRMARDNWLEQARLLQAGKHPALLAGNQPQLHS